MEARDRPVLLLLPGLLCDDEVWAAQQAALAGRCDIVVGRYGTLDRIEHMAGAVLTQVRERMQGRMQERMKERMPAGMQGQMQERFQDPAPPARFALAGHSMGGRVALEVMRQAPERVQALALLDTGTAPLAAGAAGDDERRGRLHLLDVARREGMAAMARQWTPGMVHPDVPGTPLFERMLAMVARSDPARFEAQIEALLHRPDAVDVLRSVRCPTLLLCGREDRWSPLARHQAMQALVPGATLQVVEHCGHMSPMEQPQAVNDALARWLFEGACDAR